MSVVYIIVFDASAKGASWLTSFAPLLRPSLRSWLLRANVKYDYIHYFFTILTPIVKYDFLHYFGNTLLTMF